MIHWLSIFALSVLACVTYGVIHDQITARICVEYFTIGHPRVVPSEDPTILAYVWGVLATWWVGVLLGIPLATAARLGRPPKFVVGQLFHPVAVLMAANGLFAWAAGMIGYTAATKGWIQLTGPLAQQVPSHKHIPFLIDLWAHNASYLGGFAGGIGLVIWVWRQRRNERSQDERSADSAD